MIEIITYQKGMEPEAGKCYSGMPNDVYHNELVEWFSSSDIKNALRSREYFWQEWTRKKNQEEREYKVAFEKGSAYHDAIESLILHGDLRLFKEGTVSFAGKNESKAFFETKAKYPDKNVVPHEYFKNVPEMAEKTYLAGQELNVFNGGYVELSFFWIDESTGLKLKCRTDYFRPEVDTIIDFKSTKDHREKEYKKDLANYDYHLSAAMYVEGVKQVTGVAVDCFMHIATNNTAPFEVEFYVLDNLVFQEGEFIFRKCLIEISDKKKRKPEFKKIGLPFWAITKFDKEY